jgi:hypothetical protein
MTDIEKQYLSTVECVALRGEQYDKLDDDEYFDMGNLAVGVSEGGFMNWLIGDNNECDKMSEFVSDILSSFTHKQEESHEIYKRYVIEFAKQSRGIRQDYEDYLSDLLERQLNENPFFYEDV